MQPIPVCPCARLTLNTSSLSLLTITSPVIRTNSPCDRTGSTLPFILSILPLIPFSHKLRLPHPPSINVSPGFDLHSFENRIVYTATPNSTDDQLFDPGFSFSATDVLLIWKELEGPLSSQFIPFSSLCLSSGCTPLHQHPQAMMSSAIRKIVWATSWQAACN